MVNGDQNCCEIGEKWVTDACVATLDHCIEFDGDDCTKCETGYYVNEEDFCCGNDEYFNTEH
ncbi:MAG: hypothetical protein DHS20C13_28620 [Thermodesulfobacteriota bacterium]|nr:MAG: hypothetical protein DHS20C13_28620 [Thermodesulfobacteriota bacterium]